jgi:hypothetical protein
MRGARVKGWTAMRAIDAKHVVGVPLCGSPPDQNIWQTGARIRANKSPLAGAAAAGSIIAKTMFSMVTSCR